MIEGSNLEFAHVLFMDVVGYSTLDATAQVCVLQELQELVRSQPEFRRAVATNDLLSLPTGDGMALVFFREPVAPLQCAVQISRALRSRQSFRLRIGIHSGPVYRVEDINANANVSGGGINLAQRVMDSGDSGHILLSSAVAELVGQVGKWPLEDLGHCQVKHGQKLHLFNVYGPDFGNSAKPTRLEGSGGSQKVVLLYHRGAQPDETVLETLATEFAGRGCEVFWDRHLKVGMKWAEEIRRRIWEADAVVPLISASSASSEMLAEELLETRSAADKQGGRPALLPVRVAYTGPLPEGVAIVLDPIEYATWEDEADTGRVFEELFEALGSPIGTRPARATAPSPPAAAAAAAATAATSAEELEAVGGAVPLSSRFYVERSSDPTFLTAITRHDSIVLVNGARQMGKTSLLARGLQKAREGGARVALTDFQWLGEEQLTSADTLFRALGEMLADQLDLDVYPDDVWNEKSGAPVNFQRYMRRAVLGTCESVVWGLDEVDRLFACSYGSEVFGLFRSWHNARALDPTGPWSRLTLAIAYATEAHLFITDVNQSPFNVGTRVTLADLNPAELADLNQRHGSPLRSSDELARFHRLLNGHPYLTRRGLSELVSRGIPYGELEQTSASSQGPFGDHLRRLLVLLSRDEALIGVMGGVLRGEGCPDSESFYRLRSAGIITGEAARDARPRCELYAAYLRKHLL